MSNALYDVYRKEVFLLAKTMVIKHSDIARSMNRVLREQGKGVLEDPTTWRYYKHLAGEYHETDVPMTIINLDDVGGAEVTLTKDFLANNRVTRESYQYGSRFYRQLVARFPKQESLILGMLNPVHINAAIEAADGDILYYDTALVEQYEIDLIPQLQEFIHHYFVQHYIRDYTVFNNLYLGAVLSTLYTSLPLKIMEIRLDNCHTDYVHTYHVIRHLNSIMDIGKYVPYMGRETMMFLYRNIRWIVRHAGHKRTFQKLVENVLTKQGIPIGEYDIIRTIDDADTIITRPDYEDDPYPNVRMLPRSINYPESDDTSVFKTVNDVVQKQGELLGYSDDQIAEFTDLTIQRMKPANKNELKTKVLESVMTDDTDSVRFPLGDVLINHWIYYAFNDRYLTNISIVNPATGEQLIISARKALLLYTYLIWTHRHSMTPPVYMDKFEAIMVFNDTQPTLTDVGNIADLSVINPDLVTAIMDNEISVSNIFSADDFYTHCVEIQEFMMRQFYIYDHVTDMDSHAHLKKAAGLFYGNYKLDPENTDGNDVLWSDWLADNGIILDGLLPADYLAMANRIVELSTGAGRTSSKSISAMHAAMIELMQRLSSYSIQYLRTITNTNVFPLDWGFSTYSRITQSGNDEIWVDITSQEVVDLIDKTQQSFVYETPEAVNGFEVKDVMRYNYDTDIEVVLDTQDKAVISVDMDGFSFTSEDYWVDLQNAGVTSVNEYQTP